MAPVIGPASFVVNENAANATAVGSVPVAEPEAGDTYTYSITAGDPGGAFAIDNAGNLTVADGSQLRFASQPIYTLTVQVTDDDGDVDTAAITVNLAPLFVPAPDLGPDPDPGDDPQQDPEPGTESESESEKGPRADVPPPGVFVENSAEPPALATSRLGSLEVDPEKGRGAIVYQDLNAELEQDASDPSQIKSGVERMAAALDRIRMEMTDSADEAASEQQAIVSAGQGVALAASLGWLAALLRGGSLAALAISSLPMWRGVDPLAILALSDEERKRLEEDLREAREQEDAKEKEVGRLLDDRPDLDAHGG